MRQAQVARQHLPAPTNSTSLACCARLGLQLHSDLFRMLLQHVSDCAKAGNKFLTDFFLSLLISHYLTTFYPSAARDAGLVDENDCAWRGPRRRR